MNDFAKVDNLLSASQTDIGESSNLAQIAQTYACNFNDEKYETYVATLSVLAQVAIDNSKRRFDIDLAEEIKLIKNDMDIKKNKYPKFWLIVKSNFSKNNINKDLKCAMNYLYDLDLTKYRNITPTLPMSDFFQRYPLEKDKKTCKKVEELIEKYSFEVYLDSINNQESDYFVLRSDFDELIRSIKDIYISSTYIGLFSWIIDRAFFITPMINVKRSDLKSNISKNKSLLLKTLYEVNPNNLLKIFDKK